MNSPVASDELEKILDRVAMQVLPNTVEIHTDDGRPPLRRSLRLIVPSRRGWISELLDNGWREHGDYRTHAFAARLFRLHELTSLWKRRNDRQFRLERWRRSPEFRSLRRTLGHDGPPADLIPKLYGDVSRSIDELLTEARYPNPLRFVPVDRKTYEEFRDDLLEELDDFDTLLTEAAEQYTDDDAAIKRVMADLRPYSRKLLVRHAAEFDRRTGIVLQPLADRADVLLEEAERREQRNRRTPFRRRFDWPDVTRLLADAVATLKAVHQDSIGEHREIADLQAVQRHGSIYDKANAVQWIWRNVRDRSALLENLLMDVERAGPYLLGQACLQLYREIRRFLTPPERRLFALMYLQRLPMLGKPAVFPLGGITLWFDPVLQGVLDDSRMVGLIILVAGCRVRGPEGAELAAELEARLKAYLAFYRFWLLTTRQRERESRKHRRGEARLRVNDHVDVERVAEPATKELQRSAGWVLVLQQLLDNKDAELVLRKLGINDPRHIARMRWVEGRTQREIAGLTGISQQAVSAQVRRLYGEVLEKLSERGVGVHNDLQKRKWTPRG